MIKYSLGKLVFGIDGGGPLYDAVASEIHESLLTTTAEPDVHFDFRAELPPISYRRAGDVSVGQTQLRIARGGLVLDLPREEAPRSVVVTPGSRLGSGGIRSQIRRARDWNYLDWPQTLAKNFMYNVFDWVTHLTQLAKGQSYIHASSMEKDGRGIAVLGWGGVGKSTSLLKLCVEDGWRFLSDDLGLVDSDGVLHRTPKRLQVYGYNVEGQRNLEERLLGGRSIVDRASWAYRLKRFGPHKVRRRVSAETLFGEGGAARSAPLARILFLERSSEDEKGVALAEASDVANRMAAIVMSEIEPYSTLHRQTVAAGSTFFKTPEDVERRTAEILESVFRRAPISYVRVGEQPSPDVVTSIIRDQVG